MSMTALPPTTESVPTVVVEHCPTCDLTDAVACPSCNATGLLLIRPAAAVAATNADPA